MTTQEQSIRYFTRNFRGLQGLRIIPLGLFFLAAAIGDATWTPWSDFIRDGWSTGALLLGVMLLLLYGLITVYYRRRYGIVVPAPASKKERREAAVFAAALFFAIGVDASYVAPVSFTLLVFAGAVAYGGLDGSRRYGHVLVGIGIFVVAFWPVLLGSTSGGYFTALYGLAGTGFILVGVHDHLLFIRTLRRIQSQRPQHE